MGWEQLLSSLVASLAWPIAAVVGVVLFRRPLAELIDRLRKMRTPIGEFDLAAKAIERAATDVARSDIDETSRRKEIERLVGFGVEAGWALGTDGVGFPNVALRWDEQGRASFSVYGMSPGHVAEMEQKPRSTLRREGAMGRVGITYDADSDR